MAKKDPEADWLKMAEGARVQVGALVLLRNQILALKQRPDTGLRLADVIGVYAVGVSLRLLVAQAPPKNAMWNSMRAKTETEALEMIALSCDDQVLKSEIRHEQGSTVEQKLKAWWPLWCASNLSRMRSETGEEKSRRRATLEWLVGCVKDRHFADPDEFLKMIRSGVKRARREAGLPPVAEEELNAEGFAAFLLATAAHPEKGRNYWIRGDGKIVFSPRAIRDVARMSVRHEKLLGFQPLEGLENKNEAEDWGSRPLDLSVSQETKDAVQAAIAAELAEAVEGSVEAMVLERSDVLSGDTSVAAFAREVGKPERTVRRKVASVRRKLAQVKGLEPF